MGLALIIGASFSAHAYANWITTSNNNCQAYNPNPKPNETATWSGRCKDGYADGYGTLQWYLDNKPNDTYVGYYSQGRKHGKSIYTWADGAVYKAEWKDDEKHGLGKLTLPKGHKSIASWADSNQGEWQGDTYVVQGEFIHGELDLQCEPTRQACDKVRARATKSQFGSV